ncbi:endoglucanase [Salsuginibacillus halophilus]|uniref:Endoglucanase n=1 Tax=Salsuginibacillus halophilus TaxID=517424 RepID=A0A2P8H9P8_9BACI|nr:M20/M25/M40 family metallo-hydrolase [Salsuginibacillus halophilus]PSL42921.1 endoglucanase [Salsuginibacillus halophilus]
MDQTRFLRDVAELAKLQGTPGQEMPVVSALAARFEAVADEVTVDHMGNIYAILHGSGTGPNVMVTAHSDEIGCIVKDIDADGFLKIEKTGGVLASLLVGRKVNVAGHFGVIGAKPGHLQTPEEQKQVPPIEALFVDVGAESKAEVEAMGITVGSPISYMSDIETFTNNDRFAGKAIDNRSCCVLLLALLEDLQAERNFNGTITAVVAVQEEVGLRGARVAAHNVAPDAAIVLDTIPCADTPDTKASGHAVAIGNGPVIPVLAGGAVRGHLLSPQMKNLFIRYANEREVPHQLAAMSGATTDAAAVHLEQKGILTGAITFARRYSHSPVEMADVRDFIHGFTLLKALLEDAGDWSDMSFLSTEN